MPKLSSGLIADNYVFLCLLAVFCLLAGHLVYWLCFIGDLGNVFYDEPFWLGRAYFYNLLFIKGDINSPDWQEFTSFDHPHVASYIYGFALHAVNNKLLEDDSHTRIFQWQVLNQSLEALRRGDGGGENEERIAHLENLMGGLDNTGEFTLDKKDLLVGRLTTLMFGILSAVMVAVIVHKTSGSREAGLLSGILMISNSISLKTFMLAFIDPLYLFFSLCALYSLMSYFRERTWKPALLTSIFLFLTVATKFPGVYIVPVVILPYAIDAAVNRRTIQNARTLAAMLLLASFLFFLSNPFFYPDPVQRALEMKDTKLVLIVEVQKMLYDEAFQNPLTQFMAFIEFSVLLGMKLGFLELTAYTAVYFRGVMHIVRMAIKERMGPYALLLLFVMSSYIVIGAYAHLPWHRYYIAPVASTCMILGLGLKDLFDVFRRSHITGPGCD